MEYVEGQAYPKETADLFRQFIAERRSMGYAYKEEVVRRLSAMALFFAEAGEDGLPAEGSVTAWVARRDGESPGTQRQRATAARLFGLFLQSRGIDCFILPKDSIPREASDFEAYVFTTAEIDAVAKAVDSLPFDKRYPLRHLTYPALFRVLYGCGLRISEALSLTIGNVDVEDGVLKVIESKNGKSRLVPMSGSLIGCLESYIEQARSDAKPEDPLFPGSREGKPLARQTARHNLAGAFAGAGVLTPEGKAPRVHDLRHTFACHAIERAVSQGQDPRAIIPVLATYLGHKNVADTERYLHLTESNRRAVVDLMEPFNSRVLSEASDR